MLRRRRVDGRVAGAGKTEGHEKGENHIKCGGTEIGRKLTSLFSLPPRCPNLSLMHASKLLFKIVKGAGIIRWEMAPQRISVMSEIRPRVRVRD